MNPTMQALPGNISELRFLDSYHRHTLRKPQIAADTLLRAMTVAHAPDRSALTVAVAQELAEAALRLVAVYNALSDRSKPVAARLIAPAGDSAAWEELTQEVGSISPEAMVSRLGLGGAPAALEAARQLRGEPDLSWIAGIITATQGGALVIETVPAESNRPGTVLLTGVAESGSVSMSFNNEEADAANLADYTAELCEIARTFLGVYIEARRELYRRSE